jgi:phosphohistidine phosphatase
MDSSPLTELYFIRHGIAADRGTYANDDERPVTEKGGSGIDQGGRRLMAVGCRVGCFLTSPLVRAQQTTEILLEAGLAPSWKTIQALAPDGQLSTWLPWLEEWQLVHPISRLALVGHEPDLSGWAQELVAGHQGAHWVLKKAGVIGVEVPAASRAIGQSTLFWLAPPRLLL